MNSPSPFTPFDPNAPQDGSPNSPATLTAEDKQWGMLAHLSALAGFLLPTFGHLLGPLVVWLLKKDGSKFVDEQGKEALNFQISMTIYALLVSPLVLVIIGFFLLGAIWVASFVFAIIGALRASNGQSYRYPMTLRFLK